MGTLYQRLEKDSVTKHSSNNINVKITRENIYILPKHADFSIYPIPEQKTVN